MKRNQHGGRRARRTLSDEFKREAVRMVKERGPGVPLAQIGRELDVTVDQLRAWVRQRDPEAMRGAAPGGETLAEENRRLKRELEVLRQEQAFLKKAAAYFAKESR